jgi:N-acetylmuramoyl-L-alanine amidase
MGNRAVPVEEPVFSEGGELLLPAAVVDRLVSYFFGKPLRWTYEGNVFSVGETPAPVPRPAEDEGRARTPSPPAAREGRRNFEVDVVVIDAGHGGKDPGGVGRGGIKEKDIVLDVALELARELRKRLGSRHVVVTRDKDEFLTLEERSGIANSIDPARNAVFVSVHANVSLDVKASGFESYFLSLDSYDETAREVASMENSVLSFEADGGSAYLKDIINRIVDMEYRRESRFLAEKIQSGLSGTVGRENDRGVKSAYFYVLKAVKMPSVLVEIGFVTNADEAKRLVSAEYKRRVAKGIAEGVVDFVNAFRVTEGFTKRGT